MTQNGDVPKPRDDHSLCKVDDQCFISFGGFVEGQRVNECYMGVKSGNTIEWSLMPSNGDLPCPRASHSMACHEGKCYIYGGQDDDNSKLGDLWELDIQSNTYCQIPIGDEIVGRSGHTASVYNGKMYIFGGILELTKELNEMIAYNFTTKTFEIIHENTNTEV